MRHLLAAAAACALLLVVAAGPAAAHVTVQPPTAEPGSFAKLAFRVPNERDDAGTVRVEVQFPTATPLAFVNVKPVPGWEYEVERAELEEPVEVFGEPVEDAVSVIVWEGGPIGPGEFQEFEVSVGPLPDGVEALAFPTVQVYDSGEEVDWVEPVVAGEEEPALPAPTLALAAGGAAGGDHGGDAGAHGGDDGAGAAEPSAGAGDGTDGTDGQPVAASVSNGLAIAGLVLGGVALLLALAALARAGRGQATERSSPVSTS